MLQQLLKLCLLCATLVVQSAFAEYATISTTGLYSDLSRFEIAPGVEEYAVQYPLWSNGTLKRRWIQFPANSQIDTKDGNWWNFPEGTKIWKEFGHKPEGQLKRIETRFMIRGTEGWEFHTFLWNVDDTEAVNSQGLGHANFADLGEGVYHQIPSRSMCLNCHTQGIGDSPVLGFSALQLSHDYPGLNLAELKKRGLLSHGLPETVWIKSPTPEGRKALGLLHGNCGHCHNPRGLEGELDLNLRHDIYNLEEKTENAYRTVVDKESRYSFPDHEVSFKRVLPGYPEKSILYRRVKASAHTDPFHREKMPPGRFGDMRANDELQSSLEVWIQGLLPQGFFK